MKLSDIDLNLFVVFDAIYSEGNLTRAGEIIGITQPAVSNSLSRLRNLFDDPLFVRTADGMVPTPVAQNIVGPVRQALGYIRASVQEAESFSPTDSDKRFRVSMTDLSQELLLPGLVASVKAAAPMVSVDCYQVRRRDMNIELASGNVDLAIDIPLTPDPQIRQSKLFSHDHVCVYRRGHPIASEVLNLERYLELDHVHVSARRGGLGHVDLVLGKMSRRRKVAVRTQHYLITPRLVANTDMVLTAPSMLAELIRSNYDVEIQNLPFDVPPLETYLYWHESTDSDQANQWMRNQILTLGATFR
ncbi:MAG: LysR family transcriptional regulator [Gammaproteobacteria bacterium]|nr:LysR family transcriptional regulator [Gammaproteobacteria bacterium]|tara:strand:+ start:279 stop:1187 length:909 start_codon:yes stop_codon:yes gene_type:complete